MRFASSVAAAAFLFVAPSLLQAAVQRPFPTISVSGEGTINVVPDLATATGGVISEAKTPREAAAANAQGMNAVVAALKQAGIPEPDIRTARFSVSPIYAQRREGAPQVTGYRVSNQVRVKIRDNSKVGDALDQLIAAGANSFAGLEFSVSEPGKLLDEARAAAFADAKRKAELYARAAGAQLGRAVAISESGASIPRPMTRFAAVAAAAAPSTPIAPGEDTLRVQVSVTFELNH